MIKKINSIEEYYSEYSDLEKNEMTSEEEDEFNEVRVDLIELEEKAKQSSFLLYPEKLYLEIDHVANKHKNSFYPHYQARLLFFLKVLESPEDYELENQTGTIIGSTEPTKASNISIDYSTQIKILPESHPYLTLSEYFRMDLEIPTQELYPDLKPNLPIEQVVKDYFLKKPSWSPLTQERFYLPLEFDSKNYLGEVNLENH